MIYSEWLTTYLCAVNVFIYQYTNIPIGIIVIIININKIIYDLM